MKKAIKLLDLMQEKQFKKLNPKQVIANIGTPSIKKAIKGAKEAFMIKSTFGQNFRVLKSPTAVVVITKGYEALLKDLSQFKDLTIFLNGADKEIIFSDLSKNFDVKLA